MERKGRRIEHQTGVAPFLVWDLRPRSFLWVCAGRDEATPCHAIPVGAVDLRAVPGPDDHDPAPPLPGGLHSRRYGRKSEGGRMDASVFLRVRVESLEAELAKVREENRTLREWIAELLRAESVLGDRLIAHTA